MDAHLRALGLPSGGITFRRSRRRRLKTSKDGSDEAHAGVKNASLSYPLPASGPPASTPRCLLVQQPDEERREARVCRCEQAGIDPVVDEADHGQFGEILEILDESGGSHVR